MFLSSFLPVVAPSVRMHYILILPTVLRYTYTHGCKIQEMLSLTYWEVGRWLLRILGIHLGEEPAYYFKKTLQRARVIAQRLRHLLCTLLTQFSPWNPLWSTELPEEILNAEPGLAPNKQNKTKMLPGMSIQRYTLPGRVEEQVKNVRCAGGFIVCTLLYK